MSTAILPVRVSISSGETIQAELDSFSDEQLNLLRDGQAVSYAFDDIVSLDRAEPSDQIGPTPQVTLLNGSRVKAVELQLDGEFLVISLRRQEPLRIPVKEVKSIRFRGSSPNTDAQWLGLIQKPSRGDTLAIRREEDRLDPYAGMVQGISGNRVAFDMEGTQIDAPIEKLEGVIFGGNRDVVEDAAIRIRDVYGSVWAAKAILPSESGGPVRLQLDDALEHQVPLVQIESIRWTSGLKLLATAETAAASFQPQFPTNLDAELLSSWFGPTGDGASDLVMRGDSSVEYRVDPEFSTLVGSVLRDPSIGKAGRVTLRILVDGEEQWQQSIADNRELGFELSVNKARRIRLELSTEDDGDLGDTVRIRRPRLVK